MYTLNKELDKNQKDPSTNQPSLCVSSKNMNLDLNSIEPVDAEKNCMYIFTYIYTYIYMYIYIHIHIVSNLNTHTIDLS